ncbi:MAG: tetratricopeptide repeat protein [Desulfobulbales bacterium]|nr:tetratricopeptide repeat protein [Desulfobulbales bacterium]
MKTGEDIKSISRFRSGGYFINGLILLVMLGTSFALYYPALTGPFVFDDEPNILHNQSVRMSEFTLPALEKAAFGGLMSSRPVAYLSFALNYLAGGYEVAGYHLVNILLHGLTGFILFLFFRITLQIFDGSREARSAAIVSLVAVSIWLVHPIQSQAVAYIVQRMTILAALFYLLSLLFYVYGRLAETRGKRWGFFAGAILFGFLALGSKEIAATLPVFVFLYEWFFFQDLDRTWLKKRLPLLGLALAAFLLLALFYLDFDPIDAVMASYRRRGFGLQERLLTELRVVIVYLGKIFFPSPERLSLEHDIVLSTSLFSPPATFFSATFLLTLAVVAVFAAGRARILSFALLWYLGNLLIESSLIGLELVFEHRNYLPGMFIVFYLVLLVDGLLGSKAKKIALAAVVIGLFSFWTQQRSSVWADEETLMRDNLEKAPGKFRVYYNLGTLLSEKGRHVEAIGVYNRGLEVLAGKGGAKRGTKVYYNLGILYTNLGNALASKGQYSRADVAYYRALKINPNDPNAYLGLGHNAFRRENYEKAEMHYRRALSVAGDPALKKLITRSLLRAARQR